MCLWRTFLLLKASVFCFLLLLLLEVWFSLLLLLQAVFSLGTHGTQKSSALALFSTIGFSLLILSESLSASLQSLSFSWSFHQSSFNPLAFFAVITFFVSPFLLYLLLKLLILRSFALSHLLSSWEFFLYFLAIMKFIFSWKVLTALVFLSLEKNLKLILFL